MNIAYLVLIILSTLFGVLYAYQVVFIIIGLFSKKKTYPEAKTNHTFAIVICGRNEEKVIGNLIDSIKSNDYPQDKLHIFVCADNCSENDKTAQICRDKGCIVYERQDKEKIGKGFALNFLFNHINEDYPDYQPDATLVFDADNILTKNYIKEMNKALDSGVKICTSYRNSKNFSSSWISSGASLSFMKEAVFVHRPKMKMRLSAHVSGTGFYFSKDVLTFKDGWKHTTLTEDLEFSAFNTIKGVYIGFCENAEFFDEQPIKYKQAWKQRKRWAKGSLMGLSLFHHSLFSSFLRTLDFSYYEYYFSRFFPVSVYYILSFVATNILDLITRILNVVHGSAIASVIYFLSPVLIALLTTYLGTFANNALTIIANWKRIRASAGKKILAMFTSPLFDMFVAMPSSLVAMFQKVKWDPIEHNQSITQQQLESQK